MFTRSSVRPACVLLFLLIVLGSHVSWVVGADSLSSQDQVQVAEQALGSAYLSVLNAENAGANVSSLINQLNEAAVQIDQARLMLDENDSQGAIDAAQSSFTITRSVALEAWSLKDSTLANHESSFTISLVESSIGIAVFSFIMVFGWRRFRARYVRKILNMKPVVVEDAEA
jgi:hypothetical protein